MKNKKIFFKILYYLLAIILIYIFIIGAIFLNGYIQTAFMVGVKTSDLTSKLSAGVMLKALPHAVSFAIYYISFKINKAILHVLKAKLLNSSAKSTSISENNGEKDDE